MSLNSYQQRRLFGKSQASAASRMKGRAANLMGETYYGSNSSMSNLAACIGTEGFDGAGIYNTPDFWLKGVPPGGLSFTWRQAFGLGDVSYIAPGPYMCITEKGMYCTVAEQSGASWFHVTQQGIDSPDQALRTAYFTIDDVPGTIKSYAGAILNGTVHSPAAGGPYDCDDFYFGLVSDYPTWKAGKLLAAAWKLNYDGVSAIKSADLVGMNKNNLTVQFTTRPEQLVLPTRSYQAVPRSYGTLAKQCAELGAVNWMVLPIVYETFFFSCSVAGNVVRRVGGAGFPDDPSPLTPGTKIALWGGVFQSGFPTAYGVVGAQSYTIDTLIDADSFTLIDDVTGDPVVITADFAAGNYSAQIAVLFDPYPLHKAIFEMTFEADPHGLISPQDGLEDWNESYGYEFMRQVSSVQAGAPFNAGKGYGYRTCRMWKAMLEVYPRNQCVFILDSWGLGAGGFNQLADALDYVSTDPDFFPGMTVSQIMGEQGMFTCADYPHFAATSGGDQISFFDVVALAGAGTNPSPAQWSLYTRNAIDARMVTSRAWRAALDARRPGTRSGMYEGGLTEGIFYQGFDAANLVVTAVNTGNPGSLTTPIFLASSDNPAGQAWPAYWPVAITSDATVPGGLEAPYVFVHPNSTPISLVLSATQGGPPLPITTVGSGTITASIGTGPHIKDIGLSYMAYLNSAECGTDVQYFLENVVRDGFKASFFAYYSQDGGWGAGVKGISTWGLKQAAQLPDNPATAAFKAFTDYAP